MKAIGIAESVKTRTDMTLVGKEPVTAAQVDGTLDSMTQLAGCALVIVGSPSETFELGQRALAKRSDLVVLYVDVVGDNVHIGLRDPRMEPLLTTLRDLVNRFGEEKTKREEHFSLSPEGAPELTAPYDASQASAPDDTNDCLLSEGEDEGAPPEDESEYPSPGDSGRPSLREATIHWLIALFKARLDLIPDDNGDVPGLTVTRKTLLHSLDKSLRDLPARNEADEALDRELKAACDNREPLAVAACEFPLDGLEFRFMALVLSPELDYRFQRCIGLLLDNISSHVGTLGLYSSLLGLDAAVRDVLTRRGTLAKWRLLEGYMGQLPSADEPLRVDPFFAQWLLGPRAALAADPRVRRVLLFQSWPGMAILDNIRSNVNVDAKELIAKIHRGDEARWLLLGGEYAATWRTLLELGAKKLNLPLLRVEPSSLVGMDLVEVEETARRIGRMMRLTGSALVMDLTKVDDVENEDERLQQFLTTLNELGCRAAIITANPARIVKLFGAVACELLEEQPLSTSARIAAVRAAAMGAEAHLSEETAGVIARQFPLQVDGFEHAMHLAAKRPKNFHVDYPETARFTQACRELLSENLSHLAVRIDPIFTLEQVVLSADRKKQLCEIVEHVRLAPRVLDDWNFREQLPYGRGVAALFFGPSGTGKTMAAMGVASKLGVQILRLDLSRVVSKYIGDTEKNIDRVFDDAQRSGSAILIDEADALLGKRSEVKDAHDRYANIEVAYLLQRLEAHDGLAILTTNMRQNMDAAFLRRLRFIIDFPRPDADARELIWRQCLPAHSHQLSDADYRFLARKIDFTGGNIRQATLRAAFIAAADQMLINLQHILQAVRAELAKLGMPPIELDTTKLKVFA